MNADRPAAPRPRRRPDLAGLGTLLLLAVATRWLLRDLHGSAAGELLGAPGTDALRGLWGLDHLRRSLLPPDTPVWSREVNLPAGAIGLVLPFASGLLVAPFAGLFGPVGAYNLLIGALLWGGAAASAGLTQRVTGSWPAGLTVGGLMLTQPMLLHAVYDGTPEHVALWALPATLAAAWTALERASPRRGALAGLLGAVLALDSPYYAVFCALVAGIVLPFAARGRPSEADRTGRAWALGAMLGTGALAAAAIGALYATLPVGSGGGLSARELQALNVTDLDTWRRVELGGWSPATGPAPTLIPRVELLAALGLALVGGRRALPWALAGGLSLALSFGVGPKLPEALATRWGGAGQTLGQALLALNGALGALPGLSGLRFPSRWLVVAALLLAVAGAVGLDRLLRAVPLALRWVLCAMLGLGAMLTGAERSCLRAGLPTQPMPHAEFAAWIHDQPEEGAVALLPVVRAAPPGLGRNDRPVFAGLDPAMAGLDGVTLQVLTGRAQVGAPGLQTLCPLVQDSHVARVLRDWDDLTHPRLTGDPIPPGANDPRADRARQEGVRQLVEAGLRWVAIDLSAYDDEGLAELSRQLQPWVESERTFSEGDGVRLLTLARPSP